MNADLGILGYAGPEPVIRGSFVGRIFRLGVSTLFLLIVLAFALLRSVVLLAGYVLVLAGTVLLTLGGHRSAALKLAQWRNRFGDLTRLWLDDMRRPIRRWRAARAARKQSPTPVQPIPAMSQ